MQVAKRAEMDRLLKIVTIAERLVVIFVAVAAIFPAFQWLSEGNSRDLQRTLNVIAAIKECNEFFDEATKGTLNLAKIDIYEHLCSEVSRQVTLFNKEVLPNE